MPQEGLTGQGATSRGRRGQERVASGHLVTAGKFKLELTQLTTELTHPGRLRLATPGKRPALRGSQRPHPQNEETNQARDPEDLLTLYSGRDLKDETPIHVSLLINYIHTLLFQNITRIIKHNPHPSRREVRRLEEL